MSDNQTNAVNSEANDLPQVMLPPAVPSYSDHESSNTENDSSVSTKSDQSFRKKRGRKPLNPESQLSKKSKSQILAQPTEGTLVTLTHRQWESTKSTMDDLKKQVANLTKRVNALTTQLENHTKIDTSPTILPSNLFSNLFNPSNSKPPSKIESRIISSISAYQQDTTSREKNLVIMGAAEAPNEPTPDDAAHKFVSSLFKKLHVNPDNITSCKRLKPISPHPYGIIKVNLKSKEACITAIRASNQLKGSSEYKGVFINPDLTYEQRVAERDMIKDRNLLNSHRSEEEKLKFHYGIRSGRIRKINTKPVSLTPNTVSKPITESANPAPNRVAINTNNITIDPILNDCEMPST